MTSDCTPIKICSKCKEPKLATTDCFARRTRSKDGLRSQCKVCDASFRIQDRDRQRERVYQWQRNNRDRILVKRRRRYSENKEQAQAAARLQYVKKQKDRIAYSRQYRHKNKTRVNEYSRKWRQEHPDRRRINEHKRRAHKLTAQGTHTAEDIARLYEAQSGLCKYCGKDISSGYHVDHVMPLSRGGSNSADNLALTCASCNLGKHDKTLTEWKLLKENKNE